VRVADPTRLGFHAPAPRFLCVDLPVSPVYHSPTSPVIMSMLKPDTLVGPYKILSLLGRGGMGDVYRARDTRLKRDVAIKVLSEDASSDVRRLKYFDQEARSASALNHPNIVTIYDIGRSDFGSYIAMELVEGKTLREILADGPLPPKRMLQVAAQAADGLAKAHAAGIFHRDKKPSPVSFSGPLATCRPSKPADCKLISGPTSSRLGPFFMKWRPGSAHSSVLLPSKRFPRSFVMSRNPSARSMGRYRRLAVGSPNVVLRRTPKNATAQRSTLHAISEI
jgi:serine/threonine protein kinase